MPLNKETKPNQLMRERERDRQTEKKRETETEGDRVSYSDTYSRRNVLWFYISMC